MIFIGALHSSRTKLVSSFVGYSGRIDLIKTRSFVSMTKKGISTIHHVYVSRSRNPSRPFIQKYDFSNTDPALRPELSQYNEDEADTALDKLLQSSFAESEDPEGYLTDVTVS